MILFSRLGDALKRVDDREWLLLSLETIGVLGGILIAFELQQWGAQRDQAAKHHELMERLQEETQSDVSAIRGMRDTLQPMLDREQAFAVKLAARKCPSDKEFQAITDLGMMPALAPPTSVYQELMGAGGLSSIERKDIRDHLAIFHSGIDWAQRQIDYFRSNKIRPVELADPRIRITFDAKAEEPEIWAFNGKALCRDPAFTNKVSSSTRNHLVFGSYFQATLEDAISVCVRLADSLGRKCQPAFGGPLTGADAKYAAKVLAHMRQDLAKES